MLAVKHDGSLDLIQLFAYTLGPGPWPAMPGVYLPFLNYHIVTSPAPSRVTRRGTALSAPGGTLM